MVAFRSGRLDARAIWDEAVRAALPVPLISRATALATYADAIRSAPRLIVVGAGKAGAGMAAALELVLADHLDRVQGLVNVPAGLHPSLQRIRLHTARPPGVNEPTPEGVVGADEMLSRLAGAGPSDVAFCLLSGGASALLPAPSAGLTLADKLAATRLLHRSGATINEMNRVRKHLSRAKGGGFATAFRGRLLISLIISDVVGDPLDVIGSGPTAPDPTTFADALAVIRRFGLESQLPPPALDHLARGAAGEFPDTPKHLPPHVINHIIGNNRSSLTAAATKATELGYRLLDLGSFVEGETRAVATAVAGVVRSIRDDRQPVAPPACVLIGGETTVTLGPDAGRGGRNQEFVLALLAKLASVPRGLDGVTLLSGGTDGEDGPTDAAGAIADSQTVIRAADLGLSLDDHLHRHDAYPFFDRTGDLLRIGLTGTNVMDVRVILIS